MMYLCDTFLADQRFNHRDRHRTRHTKKEKPGSHIREVSPSLANKSDSEQAKHPPKKTENKAEPKTETVTRRMVGRDVLSGRKQRPTERGKHGRTVYINMIDSLLIKGQVSDELRCG